MRKKFAILSMVLGLGIVVAVPALAVTCEKDGQTNESCCCKQTETGLVCTKTGEPLAECCCQ
jgi:hypothetical protein